MYIYTTTHKLGPFWARGTCVMRGRCARQDSAWWGRCSVQVWARQAQGNAIQVELRLCCLRGHCELRHLECAGLYYNRFRLMDFVHVCGITANDDPTFAHYDTDTWLGWLYTAWCETWRMIIAIVAVIIIMGLIWKHISRFAQRTHARAGKQARTHQHSAGKLANLKQMRHVWIHRREIRC